MSITQRVFVANKAALDLEDLLAASEEQGGDITAIEGQVDWLVAQADKLAPALDDLISISKEIEMRAEARKAEAKRLTDRAKRDVAVSEWLRGQVLRVMRERGLDRLETPQHRLTVGDAGGKQALEIVGDVPIEYTTEVTEIVTNKELIRDVLEQGTVLDFACLVAKQKILRIK